MHVKPKISDQTCVVSRLSEKSKLHAKNRQKVERLLFSIFHYNLEK